MRKFLLALLVSALLSTAAQAEWKRMNGQPVPGVSADKWLNTGKLQPTLADLRGKVYLLEFFSTG